jgi:hypothetical protein
MPTVESRIRARLRGAPSVAVLVTNRIYAGYAPQNADPPYIVVTRVSGQPLNTLAGPNSHGDHETRLQIDAIATDYGQCKAIADAIRAALSGWSDAGARITSCLLDNEQDDTEPPDDGSEVVWSRVIQDYIVWYQ